MPQTGTPNAVVSFLDQHPRLATAGGYLILALFGLAAYANSFHAAFNFDDMAVIVGNPAVTDLSSYSVAQVVRSARVFGDFTFALNQSVSGANVVGYHVVNLAIHIMAAWLLYALVTTTFRTPWCAAVASTPGAAADLARRGRFTAFFAALIFTVHPVQTQAVTYIVQRYASLATLLYLAALLLYARARLAGGDGGRRKGRTYFLYGAALLAAVLAMKTKQIAVTLPVTVFVYELTFFTGAIRRRLKAAALFLVLLALLPVGFIVTGGFSGELLDRLTALPRENPLMPRYDYLVTQFRVVVTYLRLLFAPLNQRLDYDYPVYHTLLTPPVFFSLLLLVALAVVALYCYRQAEVSARRAAADGCSLRLAAFGIGWFFITLAVESSVIPISDVIVEHRLYLPSVGAFLAIVSLLAALAGRYARRWPRIGPVLGVTLLGVALLLTVATFNRNRVWADEVSLWEDTAAKSPHLSRPLNNLAKAYIERNEPLKALPLLVRANALAPGYTDTWLNICIALDRLGLYDGRFSYGREMYDDRGAIKPQQLTAWFALASNNLGLAQDILGNRVAAMASYEKALRLTPTLAEAHFNLGLALLASGEQERAFREYQAVAELNPLLARKMRLWFYSAGRRGK